MFICVDMIGSHNIKILQEILEHTLSPGFQCTTVHIRMIYAIIYFSIFSITITIIIILSLYISM